jgi:hypothetical protein
MPVTELFFSPQLTLGPGQTRDFVQDSRGAFVNDGGCWTVFICPTPQLGNSVSLVGTTVRTDASATPQLVYTIRNNNANAAVTFRRISLRVGLV